MLLSLVINAFYAFPGFSQTNTQKTQKIHITPNLDVTPSAVEIFTADGAFYL